MLDDDPRALPSDEPLAPAPSLARYRTIRRLGSGGMADAFVVEPIDGLGRERVCLKRLRGALADDPSQRARFMDEARVLSRLCHPNVVAVLDAGADREGPFLVTELVEGLDLRRLLLWVARRGERLPERLALGIAVDVLEALSHAHAHGVVHRDVTPANVLLGRDGRVVLIDFGIARSELQSERTRTGLVKGKVPYMAPEQALGKPVDGRTDLFALGVVLFEMLSGTRPHDGASDVETITNVLHGKRVALGVTLATDGLEALLAACLASDRAERPGSARALLDALEGAERSSAGELAAWVRAACDALEVGEREASVADASDETEPGARPTSAERTWTAGRDDASTTLTVSELLLETVEQRAPLPEELGQATRGGEPSPPPSATDERAADEGGSREPRPSGLEPTERHRLPRERSFATERPARATPSGPPPEPATTAARAASAASSSLLGGLCVGLVSGGVLGALLGLWL